MNDLKKKEGVKDVGVVVEAIAPAVFGTTADLLKAAIAGENEEHTKLYPEAAAVADKEGLPEIAKRFRAISVAEKHHEERYTKLLTELENKTLFNKKDHIFWVCRECGYVHFGKQPPEKCPSCDHEKNFYQRECEEY